MSIIGDVKSKTNCSQHKGLEEAKDALDDGGHGGRTDVGRVAVDDLVLPDGVHDKPLNVDENDNGLKEAGFFSILKQIARIHCRLLWIVFFKPVINMTIMSWVI